MEKSFLITDEAGLHARPASLLVQKAANFSNNITLEYEGRVVPLKSILAVMSLGVPTNSTITIKVDGENANEVLEVLEAELVKHQLV